MPSGRTHDMITMLLAVPTFAAAYAVTREIAPAATVAGAFLFGGVMFGPDLDTVSRQYTRWSIFRSIWTAYRIFFPHRSRFTHGLIFGALFRVVYFLGVVSLLVLAGKFIYTAFSGGELPQIEELQVIATLTGETIGSWFSGYFLLLIFVGLWFGAASHTVTDIVASYIKTGRGGKFL